MKWKMLTTAVLGLGLVCATGCGGKSTTKPAPPPDEEHVHGTGPHGGVIFDMGKYHAEFKPDHEKKSATIWVLGKDQKTPLRIKADKITLAVTNSNPPITLDLTPTDANADGATTFTGSNDGFAKEMEYEGTATVIVDKKPHTGKFKEEPEKK